MRRALSPAQVTWLLTTALAAGAMALTTRTGGGPIMVLHLPGAVIAVALGAGFFFAEQFLTAISHAICVSLCTVTNLSHIGHA